MTDVPCVIQDWTEEEQLIQLIIGNIQTENHPLEIGLNALQVVQKASKQGMSAASYGEKVGLSKQVISNYVNAATVFQSVREQSQSGLTLLDISKLCEISKLPQADWCWLHDFIIEHDLSKQQVIDVVKALRPFRELPSVCAPFLPEPHVIAREILQAGQSRTLATALKFADETVLFVWLLRK
jgi:hypothetical protein